MKLFKSIKNYLKGIFLKSADKQLTEVEKLNDKLKELFKLDEGFVVTLNGEWGVGKTHFWNKFVENNLSKELEKKEIAYVSLFGKDKLSEIESDIMLQISRIEKIKDIINKTVGTAGIYGLKVSNITSIIPQTDFSNIIICFDDLERKSNKIDSKDILGLISLYKEQKKCKIIMILNKNELPDDDLSIYKDKIIDYDLHYKPTVEESYSTISNKLKVFKNYPLEYLNNKGINNIRVIKRLINALNDFEFIEKELKGYADIESEIVYPIMQLAVINSLNNNFNLKKLIEYVENKRLKKIVSPENKFEADEEYERILFYLDSGDYIFEDEILSNINYYIVNSIVDKSSLISIVNNKKVIKLREKVSKEIKEIYYKSCFDVKYSSKQYVEDMFKLFQTYDGNNLVEIAGYSSFILFINEMIEIDENNKEKYKKFAIEKLEKYIDYIMTTSRIQSIPQEIIDFDSSLNDYIKKEENKFVLLKIKTVDEVIDLMKSPIKNSGWDNEPEILNIIDKNKYIEYLTESPEFFKEAMHFIKWTKSFSNGSSFDEVANKITDAFKELRTSNKDYEFKINKVLKYLNITDSDELNKELDK
ncbi:P-loop NTPase fold protein [Aliarcobacter cryaerophilus]|uniref:P-loop NTPase fold protein n=1 Tax=Aliarcobacter cryaerophilus TaxID=28198 RepID=UPI00165448FB|nr:P-loop NTPase fold protein [Aliarcobacter cryaerophilus]QNM88694.1 hypothetical protein HOO41_03090 [Aliarcobacter cryaerophilus]